MENKFIDHSQLLCRGVLTLPLGFDRHHLSQVAALQEQVLTDKDADGIGFDITNAKIRPDGTGVQKIGYKAS